MVTIKDIAREAGVSHATVSCVLNGKAKQLRISDIASERVKAAAEQLGYQRNEIARSMVTGSKEAEPGTPASRPRRLAATALLVAVAAFGAWWLKYAPQPQPYEAGEHAQLAVAVPPAT